MGVRSKLLVPLLVLGVLFASILHLYWYPQFRATETIKLQERELEIMEVVSATLIPLLLSGNLAQIYATLDELLEQQSGWKAIHLKTADDRFLYPVTPSEDIQQANTGQWLTLPIELDGKRIAMLALKVDTDTMLASQLEKIHDLEYLLLMLLLVVIALAALLQDRWIRRPLTSLVDATSRIAGGDFNLTLPKTPARDELGRLFTTFDTMRSSLAKREKTLAQQHDLLSTIHRAQARFIRDTDVNALFDKLLLDILSITDSEYGFIGEVLYRDNKPYLKTIAITNIAWNAEMQTFFEENSPQGLEFTNLETLFGAAVTGGDAVIANDPASDPRSGGLPPGHPALNAFLGIPFRRGKKVIGMYGIANRVNGYDQALVEFLEPITATCTHIVEALKADRQREQAEEQLRERETRMRTLFENVVDGIITTNEKGIIESFNRAAENMFGYAADEVIGSNVGILTPATHRVRHDKYIKDYIKGRESKIMGAGREVEGVRKDGSSFPIDIAVTEMWVGGARLFCSIMRDITERKKVERMKNEFVSTVSHELRTPLTSIRGALGLVGSGVAGELPDQAQPLVDIAAKNCDRLVRLINDILDLEKIEANKMEFIIQPLELMPLVSQTVESNRAYADEYGVNIIASEGMPGAVVQVDEDRFVQVLTNLLSNAAKFSPRGGTIRIATHAHNEGVRVSVSDEGPGIPEAFREQIFEKFSQADGSDTRQKGGSGLGLSITRTIVEKLGGHIEFETQEGKGTTFHVDLPLHASLLATVDRVADERPESTATGARILVCEDEADVAHLLRLMLQAQGYDVEIARNASEAKALLAKREYAAMTLDLVLPDQYGIDLFRDIRRNEKTRELPVIVVSAIADEEVQQLSGDAVQVMDWLEKPIDESKLVSAVARSISHSTERPMRILHVEDEPDVHEIVRSVLGDSYQLSSAGTLDEARQRLAREDFDLVILDLGLPDGSGVSLLPGLSRRSPRVPVVLFSAHEVDAQLAREVTATLVKSKTTNATLIETIHSTIARQPQLAEEA
jgi:PAS domain S-box-containing protein